MIFLRNNLFSLIALLGMVVASLLFHSSMPESVPVHFNWQGNPDGFAPRTVAAVMLPAAFLVIIVMMQFLFRISPRQFSMPSSARAVDITVFSIGVLFLFLHYALLTTYEDQGGFQRLFGYGMAGFLVICGNVLGKTEPNFFIGIRIPWTIASMANWKATHRLAGLLMVLAGVVLLITNSVAPSQKITVSLTVAAVVVPVFYSIYFYFTRERDQEGAD